MTLTNNTFKVGDKVVNFKSRFRHVETITRFSLDGNKCVLGYGGGQNTWHKLEELATPNEENTQYQGATNIVFYNH